MTQSTGDKELARRLKEAREASGKTQQEAARLIGKANTAISHYELGTRGVPVPILKRLAEIYGVTFSYLLGVEEPDDGEIDLFEDEIPEQFRKIGIEYMRVAKRAEQLNITPEDAITILEAVSKVKKSSR